MSVRMSSPKGCCSRPLKSVLLLRWILCERNISRAPGSLQICSSPVTSGKRGNSSKLHPTSKSQGACGRGGKRRSVHQKTLTFSSTTQQLPTHVHVTLLRRLPCDVALERYMNEIDGIGGMPHHFSNVFSWPVKMDSHVLMLSTCKTVECVRCLGNSLSLHVLCHFL